MINKTYYHGITRKAIIAFGVMFNNLHIRRRDAAGNLVQSLRVPLAYAAKNKMLARINALPDPEAKQAQITLPRMSFEVIAFEYDGQRKINVYNKTAATISETQAKRVYGPVPYNLTVNLYAYAKNQDDGLQIFEQIVPAFNPDFNVSVNYIPSMGIKHDLPIILNSVTFDDSYEGDVATSRMIIWTFTFTLKLYYYGPAETEGVIRQAITSVFDDPDLANLTDKYTVTTNPGDALPGSTFDFVQTNG
jgi:hypothetical protein